MADANQARRRALRLSLPVLAGYVVLGIAFGATLAQAGYGAAWALLISTTVYAGSLQFVMVPLMASGASLITVALTALMVNARHVFYGLSFVERFSGLGRLRPYLIFSLTDETYSVFCGMDERESGGVMVRVAAYDQLYWIAGSVAGALMAQGLPFDLTGIDFSMTALFAVICVERAMNRADRLPMVLGACLAVGALLLLGPDAFLAPALAATALVLTVVQTRTGREEEAHG